MNELDPSIAKAIGDNIWWLVVLFVTMFFKGAIGNIVDSLTIFYGNDINDDDVLLIDGRGARVVRVGAFKTTFYIYSIDRDGNFKNGTRMQIENSKLKDLKIEKPLPLFDSFLIELIKQKD